MDYDNDNDSGGNRLSNVIEVGLTIALVGVAIMGIYLTVVNTTFGKTFLDKVQGYVSHQDGSYTTPPSTAAQGQDN